MAAVFFAMGAAPTRAAEELLTRLRITLGDDGPVAWRGVIEVEGGRLEKLQPLNLDARAASAVWLEEGDSEGAGLLRLAHRRPQARDAFDVTVRHGPDATLRFSSPNLKGEEAATEALPLSVLRESKQSAAIGESGAWLVAERLSADRLRIETDRESLLFNPSEEFGFEVVTDPQGVEPGEAFDFAVSLSRGRAGGVVWQAETRRVEAPHDSVEPIKLPVSVPLPSEEGVYRLTLRASRPPGFTRRFMPAGKSHVLVERTVQLAVFDASAPPRAPGGWKETYAFDPASQRWGDRVPDWIGWRRLPWFESGPVASTAGSGRTPGGKHLTIPAAPARGESHWRAYPLPIAQPGRPYTIEVEAPADGPQQLTIAVLDGDALGVLRPLGEGVTVETPRWNRQPGTRVGRLVVWPRTNSPLLVVSNPSIEGPARFGRIRLLESTGSAETRESDSERLVALDWPTADLPRVVGATHADVGGQYEAADLQTFYETARRLADRVELAGANGAVVDVVGGGGAVYPSTQQSGSPRFDLGVWGDGAGDLPRRPLLDLMLREFDRRGLRLLPAVRFEAPLPAVERRFAQQGGAAAITDPSADTCYNPIDPAVVASQQAVVEELAALGRGRRSLAGVAVRIGRSDWSLLSDDPCGYDAATVDRFLAVEGLRWPAGVDRTPDSHAAALQRNAAEAWRAWRGDQLAEGYQRIAYRLQQAAPDGVGLVVLPTAMQRSDALAVALTPRLAGGDAEEAVAATGILSLARSPGPVTVARTEGVTTAEPLSSVAGEVAAIGSLSDALPPAGPRGAVARVAVRRAFRLIDSTRLLRGEDAKGFGEVLLTAVTAPPAGDAAATAEAVRAGIVIDGAAAAVGWLDEGATQQRRRLAATPLPSAAPDTAPDTAADTAQTPETPDGSNDLLVTAFETEQGSCVVASNPTPWPLAGGWTIDTPHRVLATRLDAQRNAVWFTAGRHVVTEEIAPYSTVAWRFSEAGVRVLGVRREPNTLAREELTAALADLQSRDTTIHHTIDLLPNPSFELTADGGEPAGWALDNAGVNDAAGPAYEGERALTLGAATDQTAAAVSDPFPMPETGQLVLALRLRPIEVGPATRLEVSLAEQGGAYKNQTSVSGEALTTAIETSETPGNGEAWREVLFPVDDLPLGGGRLALTLELTGGGRIAVDGLRCEDLILPLDGYASADLRAEKLALVRLQQSAVGALSEERLEDCRRVLDSYWARFLTTHFPPVAAPAEPPEDTPIAEEAGGEAETEEASVADRLRGYLPRWWR